MVFVFTVDTHMRGRILITDTFLFYYVNFVRKDGFCNLIQKIFYQSAHYFYSWYLAFNYPSFFIDFLPFIIVTVAFIPEMETQNLWI
jgi:hypothetical protein